MGACGTLLFGYFVCVVGATSCFAPCSSDSGIYTDALKNLVYGIEPSLRCRLTSVETSKLKSEVAVLREGGFSLATIYKVVEMPLILQSTSIYRINFSFHVLSLEKGPAPKLKQRSHGQSFGSERGIRSM